MAASRRLPTCVALDIADHAAIVRFCRDARIDFVVIGPEAPLVAGLGDDLAAAGIKHFGPSKAAAQLEGSKGFTKDLCAEFGIPTGAYGRFKDAPERKGLPRARNRTADRGQGRWSGRRQGRGHRRDAGRGRGGRRRLLRRRLRRGRRRGGRSRSSSTARRRASSRCATAPTCCRSPPPRITSASAMAIPARTPAAWAPIRRPRS